LEKFNNIIQITNKTLNNTGPCGTLDITSKGDNRTRARVKGTAKIKINGINLGREQSK
jgi:hypothetical protein